MARSENVFVLYTRHRPIKVCTQYYLHEKAKITKAFQEKVSKQQQNTELNIQLRHDDVSSKHCQQCNRK